MLSGLLSSVLRVRPCLGWSGGVEAFEGMLTLGQWHEEQTVTRSSVGREKEHEREQARKQEEQQPMESTEQGGRKQNQQQ